MPYHTFKADRKYIKWNTSSKIPGDCIWSKFCSLQHSSFPVANSSASIAALKCLGFPGNVTNKEQRAGEIYSPVYNSSLSSVTSWNGSFPTTVF